MGIILSALAGAGDSGAQSIDQNLKQQRALDLDAARSDLEQKKALAILSATKQAQIDTANQLRTEQSGRLAAAKDAVIAQQMGQKYAPADAAVAAADAGQTDAPLTPEQKAAIEQSKGIDYQSLAADPHSYIAAAMKTGDIDPKTVAELAQQADALKRQLASQEAQFAHADASQERSQRFAAEQQGRAQSFQAGESEKGREATAQLRSTDPAVIETNAQAIATGQMPPLTGYALRSPGAAATMARVMQIKPDYSAKDYGTQSKAEKDFATGKQGNSVRSFNVALSHLDTLDKLADALKNGDVQALNRFGNYIATQTGAPAPTNFDAVKHIVADEIVKAVTGSAGALGDREAAAKTIQSANSPAQLKGVVAQYKELMVGQLHGLRDQYKATTGKEDFDTKYLSEAARTLANHGRATALNPVASGTPADITDLLNKYGK
jgi:hypothetical protein